MGRSLHMYTNIKESMTSCMTLKTVIMVTRTKLLFVADIHSNACTVHILYSMNTTINAEPNFYDFHCQVLFIQTIYKQKNTNLMKVCSCIIAYVYSQ